MTLLTYQKKALAQLKRIKTGQEKLMAMTEEFYPILKKESREAAASLVLISIRYQKELDLTNREIVALEKETAPVKGVENA